MATCLGAGLAAFLTAALRAGASRSTCLGAGRPNQPRLAGGSSTTSSGAALRPNSAAGATAARAGRRGWAALLPAKAARCVCRACIVAGGIRDKRRAARGAK